MSINDVNLDFIKSRYPIKKAFKNIQKVTNTGKTIPFEDIDISLYRKQANCVSFITSTNRIHAWVLVLAERLYGVLNLSDEYNVVWVDKAGADGCAQTEFCVHDGNAESEDGDDFLYKVIVYLSCGKVMVQGKRFKDWCDEEFALCLAAVNKTASEDISEQTIPKCVDDEDQIPYKDLEQINIGMDSDLSNNDIDSEQTNNKMDSEQTNNSNDPEQTNNMMVSAQTNNRMDVLEQALVNVTEKVTQMCSVLQIQVQENTNKTMAHKINKIEDSVARLGKNLDLLIAAQESNERPQDSDRVEALETSIIEKNKTLETVTSMAKDMEMAHKREIDRIEKENSHLRKQLRDKDLVAEKLEKEKQELRDECLELNTKMSENVKGYEQRLKDKDNTNRDLQERLRTALYESNGEPWSIKQPRVPSTQASINNDNGSPDQRLSKSQANPVNVNGRQKQPNEEQHETWAAVAQRNSESEVIFVRDDKESEQITIIHDSILNDLISERFTARTGKTARKMKASTITEACGLINDDYQADTTIIHVGVNDLRETSAETAFKHYKELLVKLKQKTKNCVVSLVIPSSDSLLNDKITLFNTLVVEHVRQPINKDVIPEYTKYSFNRNLGFKGTPKSSLYRDSVHVNDKGLALLIGNIKACTFSRQQKDGTTNSQHRRRGHGRFTKQNRQRQQTNNREQSQSSTANDLVAGIAKVFMDIISSHK